MHICVCLRTTNLIFWKKNAKPYFYTLKNWEKIIIKKNKEILKLYLKSWAVRPNTHLSGKSKITPCTPRRSEKNQSQSQRLWAI